MLIPPAYAQVAGGTGSDGLGSIMLFAPYILLAVGFYFLIMRPQQKRAKALRDAIAAIKKNDQVVTSGGIMGKVTKVADATIEVEIAPTVKVQVVRGAITEVILPNTAKPAND